MNEISTDLDDWFNMEHISGPLKRVIAQVDARRISEKRVQGQVVKNLRELGFFVSTFSQAQKAQMTAGIPDVFAAHGRFGCNLWIEVKAPHRRNHKNGGLSDGQIRWHELAREAGLDVVTAYGWCDVANELRKRGVPIRF